MTGYVVLVFLSLVHFTFFYLAPDVQRLESTIHWIHYYPQVLVVLNRFCCLFINLLYDNLSTGLLSTALLLEPLGSDAILYEILIIVISCENNCMTHLFSIE